MGVKNNSIFSYIKSPQWKIYFFGLWGVQILILLVYIFGLKESSQLFTIPYRIFFIVYTLFVFFHYQLAKVFFYNRKIHLIFLFYLFIVIRILLDTYILIKDMGIPGETYLFRFNSMIIFPSLAFLLPLNEDTSLKAKNGIKYSCIIFLILGLFFYRNELGLDYRSSQFDNEMGNDEFISPMAFSYIGFTLFGILIWEFFYKKKNDLYFILFLGLSLFSIIWSGTRNVILGVIFILLYSTLQNTKNIKDFFKILMFWFIGGIGSFFILQKIGTQVISRFEVLFYELSVGDSNAGSMRSIIWENGFNQFWNSPIFGSGLEEEEIKYVAHNMYLEAFMATGVVGGLLFISILFFTYRNGYKLLNSNSSMGWLMILFLERCFTGMLSTSILDPLFWLVVVAINANSLKKI